MERRISIMLEDFTLSVGERNLIENASVKMPSQTLVALIGRNGAGKSTLLRALAGLNRNYSGEILIEGEDIKRLDPQRLAKLVAFVTTERVRIPNLKCRDVVAMGRAPFTDWMGRLSKEDVGIVDAALVSIGMTAFAHRTMDSMSDGECQRIMIARALAQSTPIIMLDEPTSFLDLPARYELVELLQRLAQDDGKLVIFSTHELDIAMKLADRIALVADKELYYDSPPVLRSSGLLEEKFGEMITRYL